MGPVESQKTHGIGIAPRSTERPIDSIEGDYPPSKLDSIAIAKRGGRCLQSALIPDCILSVESVHQRYELLPLVGGEIVRAKR
jgi:hypothetical protein